MIREYTEKRYYATIRIRVPNGIEIPKGIVSPFLIENGINLNNFVDYYRGEHPNLIVLECDHHSDRDCAVMDETGAREYLAIVLPDGWEVIP